MFYVRNCIVSTNESGFLLHVSIRKPAKVSKAGQGRHRKCVWEETRVELYSSSMNGDVAFFSVVTQYFCNECKLEQHHC